MCKRSIYAVVTYQSMAALEALHYGIPAFTMAQLRRQCS